MRLIQAHTQVRRYGPVHTPAEQPHPHCPFFWGGSAV